MRPLRVPLAALLLLLAGAPAAIAAANDDAVGIAIDWSKMSFDSLADDIDESGFTAFRKIGADPRWGFVLAYKVIVQVLIFTVQGAWRPIVHL